MEERDIETIHTAQGQKLQYIYIWSEGGRDNAYKPQHKTIYYILYIIYMEGGRESFLLYETCN